MSACRHVIAQPGDAGGWADDAWPGEGSMGAGWAGDSAAGDGDGCGGGALTTMGTGRGLVAPQPIKKRRHAWQRFITGSKRAVTDFIP